MAQAKMIAAVVTEPNKLVFEERAIPEPKQDEVVIQVKATGLCHSDCFAMTAGFPGIKLPLVPGHEVAGVIVAVGPGHRTAGWKEGDHVGVGWLGTCCNEPVCEACTAGDFITCPKIRVTGIHNDGGYATYMVARGDSCARMPEGMDFTQAAPLCCAGVTVFNALRHNVRPAGALVAVQGIGGLGHLGIQYASKMGYRVVAVSRGNAKTELAMSLGAHHYIDSEAGDVAEALQALGGAAIVLATAFNAAAMTKLINGLARNGVLIVLGADHEPIEVTPLQLITARKSVQGHPSGTARDSQDAMAFAQLHGVKVTTKIFPFPKAKEAYDAMMAGSFRVVLDMTQE
ncbi:alcohol dehydrogenase [Tribonema minus]|uniref:Alcohol dehydrogenase n=1 Tax=Tribonema minus TaxID=303371 RepID=A0A835ZBP4_9STRA|nr:alcohol dehydrogenase [Tribonema minus]